jgi:hypothetical protein
VFHEEINFGIDLLEVVLAVPGKESHDAELGHDVSRYADHAVLRVQNFVTRQLVGWHSVGTGIGEKGNAELVYTASG